MFFLGTIASAQNRIGEAVFHRYDKNGDGIVSSGELPDAATRARFDQNGDGDVTLAEFRAASGQPQANPVEESSAQKIDEFVKSADTNGDGSLSREEAGNAEWFDRVDRNGNGLIEKSEITRVRRLASVADFLKRGKNNDSPAPSVSKEEVAEITSGPEILKPGDVGIGRMLPDVSFTDLDGGERRLSDVANHRGMVIAMTSATCPLSKRFLPTLKDLSEEFARHDIPVVLVNAFKSEDEEAIRAQLEATGYEGTYVHDIEKTVSRVLRAETTTEVFLIDPKRTLIYRGALNDQYGIDYSIQEPRHHYLVDAVAAFLEKTTPEIAATKAPGCEIDLGDSNGELVSTDITYHRDVERILQQNCVECHRDEGIAPFPLDDYDEVTDRARVIQRVIAEGTMPPWFATPPAEGETPWINDRSLSDRDKSDLLAWLGSSERPMGDPAEAPEPIEFPSEWSIGDPDMILPLSRAYEIKATGFMPYQYDVVETSLTEDKWVSAYEILPSERDVVHHVIVQVFEKGEKLRQRAEGAGGYWAAYVPGNGSHVFPEGFAKKLSAGSRISFQIHYTPSGVAKTERLRMGLKFADEPPKFEVKTMALADRFLRIPPRTAGHKEGMSRKLTFDTPVMGYMPHMHTRGSAFTYEVTYPDGRHEVLLDIPRYDFNWQLRYDLKSPKWLPRGSTIKVTGVFDNSVNNKANPDPDKMVKWGSQTVDEMLIGYIEYFVPVSKGDVAASN